MVNLLKVDLAAPALQTAVALGVKGVVHYLGHATFILNLTTWQAAAVYTSVAAIVDRIVKNFFHEPQGFVDYFVSAGLGGLTGYYAALWLHNPITWQAAAIFSAVILGFRFIKDHVDENGLHLHSRFDIDLGRGANVQA